MPSILSYTMPEFRVRSDLPKIGGRDQLELTANFAFDICSERGNKYSLTIPAGYIFDGASIPRVLWWFDPPVSDWIAGAVIHDWGYYTRCITRLELDNMLVQVVRMEGHGNAYQKAIHSSVRLFGKGAYKEGDCYSAREELRLLGGSCPWSDPHFQAESWSVLSDYPGAAA